MGYYSLVIGLAIGLLNLSSVTGRIILGKNLASFEPYLKLLNRLVIFTYSGHVANHWSAFFGLELQLLSNKFLF